jgi:peptidoglycan hydrolase-like protein with peptidoglycan-binding domain
VSACAELLEHPRRDLGSEELWARSLARSRLRRVSATDGEPTPRSLFSVALVDLDGPLERRAHRIPPNRDLADPEVWDISLARVRAKRRAAEPSLLPQARVAGASLLVAAVAAALPVQSGAHSRARTSGATRSHVELLRFGSRGPAVTEVQRALGIDADGIFGPRTRAAVRSFQRGHGLLVDGIVGPQTRAALAQQRGGWAGGSLLRMGSRGPAVAALQRDLGIPADGIFGPQTKRSVRAFQSEHELTVDGIAGPQTLAALKSHRVGGGSASPERRSSSSTPVRSVDERLWGELALARRMGLTLWSAYRPGSTLGSGRRSDHSYYPSKAIDVAGSTASMRRYARAVAGMPGVDIVIHSPVGIWQAGVGWTEIDSSTTRREHYDHVHVDTF